MDICAKLVLIDPAFVVLQFESQESAAGLAFTCVAFVPCPVAEWLARVDRAR